MNVRAVSQAGLKVEESHGAGCRGSFRGSPTRSPRLYFLSPLFFFFFCSSASTAPSYSPGKIFSKESDSLVHKAVWCVCVCVFVCVCYTAPTWGAEEHFVVQVTVMCLFLTGCRRGEVINVRLVVIVWSQALRGNISTSAWHTHTYVTPSKTFEETPVWALWREVSHLYDLWRLQSEVWLVSCVCERERIVAG